MSKKRTKLSITGEVIRYGISGGAFFWSGYLVFAILYSGLGLSLGPAKITAYLIGLSINFGLQRWWVFKSGRPKKNLPKVTGKYLLLSLVNLGIDYVIVVGLAELGMSPYLGQFVSAAFFTVWNYVWYKFIVFKKESA